MRLKLCLILETILLSNLSVLPLLAQSPSVSFSVQHSHRFGHCEGLLRIEKDGIVYETKHGGHARVWWFSDIRHIEIRSKTSLVVLTYGKPAAFDFRLREGELTIEAYRLLAEHIQRGLTSRVLFPATEFRFAFPVKHRHRLGGCEGILRIGTMEIVYETENAEDKRIWRIRDIRSFGTTGPYDLRLATEEETFTFDLKEPLSQEVYDHLWQKIYGPQFAPVRD